MSTINVVRYSFLGAGVVYGYIHRNSLAAAHAEELRVAQYKKEEKLINEAKSEFLKTMGSKATA